MPDVSSDTFPAVIKVISQCPKSLTKIELRLRLLSNHRNFPQMMPRELRRMDAEFSLLKSLPTIQPRLAELRWTWKTSDRDPEGEELPFGNLSG